MRDGSRIRLADGCIFGTGEGSFILEVFDPPWWRLDRWLSWWCSDSRLRGKVDVGGTVVRARESKVRLPNVPRPFVEHVRPGVPPAGT